MISIKVTKIALLILLLTILSTLLIHQNFYDKSSIIPNAEFRVIYLDIHNHKTIFPIQGFDEIHTQPLYGSITYEDNQLIYQMPNLSNLIVSPNSEAPRFDEFAVDSEIIDGHFTRTSFKVYFSSDPLSIYQWYIQNYGLNSYDTQGFNQDGEILYPRKSWSFIGSAGLDLNVPQAWSLGATGKGVGVIVYDSGVDPTNPDLKDQLDLSKAQNFITGTYSTQNKDYRAYTHGTKVAGIIAAKAYNQLGIRGIAYDSTIIPWRYNDVWEDYLLFDFPKEAKVFQNSVGNDPGRLINTEPYSPSILNADLVYFLSKGNYYTINYYEQAPNGQDLDLLYHGCIFYQINCAETPKLSTMPIYYPILAGVSGINANGQHLDYANFHKYILGLNASTGSDVMFVGFNTTSLTSVSSSSKGIFTTGVPMPQDNKALSLLSSFKNSANYESFYSFYTSQDPDNPDTAFTGNFSGTSAAAPMLSAVAALVRSVNPKLTWADTYDILIQASSLNKLETRFGVSDKMNLWFEDGINIMVERPAEKNAAGYLHSNVYGFGLIDAAKAVKIAQTYQPSDLQKINRHFLNSTKIEFHDLTFKASKYVRKATSEVSASTNAEGRIFSVVLEIPPEFLQKFETKKHACNRSMKISSNNTTYYRDIYYNRHCFISDLTFTQLELESPSGKISIIKPMGSMYLIMKNLDLPHRIESKAFYGENPKGLWKIRAITSRGERWKVRFNDPEQKVTLNRSAKRKDLITDVKLEIYTLPSRDKK